MLKLPKIGLRMVKTCIAVFLCFVVYWLCGRRGVPFYAAIAAILCMQQDIQNSRKVALNRTVGTLIGGAYGILCLYLLKALMRDMDSLLYYAVVSAALLPLIYITVLVNKKAATYITCVVFLSITVSHSGEASAFAFGLSRIAETLAGIFISFGVNCFHLPRSKNSDLLMATSLDGALLGPGGTLSSFSKVKLNQLIGRGARITAATSRSPSSIVNVLSGVNFSLPIIVMNGAALYDMKTRQYLDVKVIEPGVAGEILSLFDRFEVNAFACSIVDDILHIYFENLSNPVQRQFYDDRKNTILQTFLQQRLPRDKPVSFFTVYENHEKVRSLYKALLELPGHEEINAVYYKDTAHPGYYVLNVSGRNAAKGLALKDLQARLGLSQCAVFADDLNDLSMLYRTPHSYAVKNSTPKIQECAAHIIGDNVSDAVVKEMQKLYYHPAWLAAEEKVKKEPDGEF